MTDDRSQTRTETAREHDDSDLAETVEPTPGGQGRAGGDIERDVATEDEKKQGVSGDTAGVTRVTKEDEIEHGERPDHERRPDMTP